ncbi:MAG TPA: hypothetical protein PLJ47_00075 [Candidatus Hydrogenedentes bacterium]|nr:hypothetical protein [Candidatus Hydrogenedentota bacterium]
MRFSFEFSSPLRADPESVWAHARTISGVNAELWPLCRMTFPPAYASRTLEDAPIGQRAFRSWILLFGVVPIDYDDLKLLRVEAPRGFVEESTMLTQRIWRHERTIERTERGCCIRDSVAFEPRVPLLGPLFLPMFKLAFWNRHRRLRARFGSA